ncbi:MAG: TadA family conjugal transfer-associated ATPase [Actinomycetaceae bacterium]|nr:TadA family conjugal transfer-associated ATPase [Actinomycetaceae bacterium]
MKTTIDKAENQSRDNSSFDISTIRHTIAGGTPASDAIGQAYPTAISVHDVLGKTKELRSAIGVGSALQKLLDDKKVTDILVNGSSGVWVDRGCGLERDEVTSTQLNTENEVRALATRLAASAGQRLDDSSPIVDGTFSGGFRLHAVLPPLGAEGTLISLRTQRTIAFSVDELQEAQMFPQDLRPVLDALVARRANTMISGATGSGKTTLLAALLAEIPSSQRLLVIEESAELRPRHEHVVHLQVRHANVQGVGEIGMSDLVRAAMRMRPDRIILGECRGAEVREVLSALNTGHEGDWATIHANSAIDVPSRLVALGALANMSEAVVAAQAASALDAVIHVERINGHRAIRQIACLERAGGELFARPALVCTKTGVYAKEAWGSLARRLHMDEAMYYPVHAQKRVPTQEASCL